MQPVSPLLATVLKEIEKFFKKGVDKRGVLPYTTVERLFK